ncbi:putative DNA primase/helicase [Paraburkholderia bannensis]|uniref:Putative DNA primase/helicase n=1 Tax=Paraburkholderia bannensis TaxID=765414 RepID=A0A7W9TUL8_9BURK|nr:MULTISPECIES: DUF927 domain-containing protein [Paraburkholderia]MBB3255448.1 putative DNA primase/helicase [Paraburkholderia sp. WP4_3_2]MBB6100540.1 putative DNA primase/helicase [Paraburkholderia bannensis]
MMAITGEERIRAAMGFIPADLERDEWVRVGASLKHEMGDGGFELFDEWSQRGKSYDAAAVRSTWRSLSADGGIAINTLFHIAKGFGFDTRSPAAATVDSALQARSRAEREQRAAQDAQNREARASHAAATSFAVLANAAAVSATNPYLVLKGIQPVDGLCEIVAAKLATLIDYQPKSGDMPLEGRILIVPVMVGGKLSTIEMIDGGGRKAALAGGVKAGGFWATGPIAEDAPLIHICEGVATALSVHECTGAPAVAALSCGNLLKVAEALKAKHPAARLVVCGDLGNGAEKAREAAQAVGGVAVYPTFDGERDAGLSDFNDMHAARGASAVTAVLDAAMAAVIEGKRESAYGPNGDPVEHVSVSPSGTYFVGVKVDSETGDLTHAAPLWLCDPLEILGIGSDDSGRQVRVLRWNRPGNKQAVTTAMPCAEIGEREGWSRLRNGGLAVAVGRSARERLALWLQTWNRETHYKIISLPGWQCRSFVMPDGTVIGTPDGRMHFDGRLSNPAAYAACGTLDEWRASVGRLARGNALPMAAIACALAGPLLPIAGEKDGIGLHLYANTSSGKTTCGDVAASVWGDPLRTKTSWSGTSLGHALNAEAANHRLLYLDEIGAGDASRIGPALYLMLNGQSKSQGARDGGTVAARSWLSTLLSTGEVAMSRYLSEGGLQPRGGQEIRMLDVPADGGAHRAFDCLHEFATAGEFAEAFSSASHECHGSLGRAFVEWLVSRWDEARDTINRERERMAAMVPDGSAPPVRRATRKFAILSAAAVLAARAGLTGWTQEEARAAIDCVWKRWLDVFGTGDRDDARLIEQANAVLLSNEFGRFILLSTEADPQEPSVRDAMGFRRYKDDQVTFYVREHAFRNEVIAGFDMLRACRVLHEAGMLHRNEKRRSYKVNIGKFKGINLGDGYRMRSRAGEAPPDDDDE